MIRDGRYRYWLLRGRDHLRSTVTFVALVLSSMRGRARIIWLGDSHAGHFAGRFATANLLRDGRGLFVVHLGARLMHSVSRQGFPSWVARVLRVRQWIGRCPYTLVVCLGEIDVRCHLAAHAQDGAIDTNFVADYVTRVRQLAHDCGADRLVLLVPPPPCVDQLDIAQFPVLGTFAQRVAVFDQLRARLADESALAAGSAAPVIFVDPTDLLWDEAHGMQVGLSDDRCHTNAAGARLVRELVGQRAAAADT